MREGNEVCVNLQFNSKIIKRFKDHDISADHIGSTYITLEALRQNNLAVLDTLDDESLERRMNILYRTLTRKELLEEDTSDSTSYYKLTKKAVELLKAITNDVDDEIPITEPIMAVQAKPIDLDWITEYINLFPKPKRCHAKVILERLEKFKKAFPEYYDKDLILKATKMYIKEAQEKENGLIYIRESHYYIFKQEAGGTTYDLATWCQKVLEVKEENQFDTSFLDIA